MATAPENGSAAPRAGAPELRRPADVWLPAWWGELPVALDVALTSGLTERGLRDTIADAAAPVVAVARQSQTLGLDTEQSRRVGHPQSRRRIQL